MEMEITKVLKFFKENILNIKVLLDVLKLDHKIIFFITFLQQLRSVNYFLAQQSNRRVIFLHKKQIMRKRS